MQPGELGSQGVLAPLTRWGWGAPCQGIQALHVFWGALGTRFFAGTFVPSCDEDGYYRRAQCEPGGAQCWCVDPQHGTELSGTRSHGHPDCGELGETVW